MSDGFLSQDEIDALLGGADGGFDGEETNDLDVEAVGEVVRVATEASLESLSRIMPVPMSLELKSVDLGVVETMLGQAEGERLAAVVGLQGDLTGTLVYALPKEGAALIGEWMSGNAPLEELELTEEALSGFHEAMNELTPHLSSSLSTILSANVDAGLNDAVLLPLSDDELSPVPLSPEERVVRVRAGLNVGEERFDADVYVPYDVAAEIVAILSAHAPAEEPSPEPPSQPFADEAVPAPTRAAPKSNVGEPEFADLGADNGRGKGRNIDLLLDVPLQVTVELGQTRMQIREILELGRGSVVELEKLAGEPVEVFVNGKLIAKGEVVTIDENFGVKITDIVSRAERVNNLR